MNEKMNKVLKKFKEKTLKKCYKIELLEEEPKLTDSKLGGIPYLPQNKEYPKDRFGNAMPLLAQINLAEISLESYPQKGLLQIYVDKSLSYPADYKIIYIENMEETCNTQLPDIDLSEFVLQEAIKIKLVPNETYMPLGDYRFEETFSQIFNEVFQTNITSIFDIDTILPTKNEYDNFLSQLNIAPGLIGGYADFTQTDPRTYERKDLEECIIKIDSQLDLDRIVIGDAGILWVYISKQNLKDKRFDKAVLDWDCC